MFSFNLFASIGTDRGRGRRNCISGSVRNSGDEQGPVKQYREIRKPYYTRALRIKHRAHNREHGLAHDHDPFPVHKIHPRVAPWFATLAGPEIDLQRACSLGGCRPLLIRFHRRTRPRSL